MGCYRKGGLLSIGVSVNGKAKRLPPVGPDCSRLPSGERTTLGVRGGVSREIADFGATTPELIRMTKWLQARGVESVAVESSGVYRIAPHEVLEAAGSEILLVDTRHCPACTKKPLTRPKASRGLVLFDV